MDEDLRRRSRVVRCKGDVTRINETHRNGTSRRWQIANINVHDPVRRNDSDRSLRHHAVILEVQSACEIERIRWRWIRVSIDFYHYMKRNRSTVTRVGNCRRAY